MKHLVALLSGDNVEAADDDCSFVCSFTNREHAWKN